MNGYVVYDTDGGNRLFLFFSHSQGRLGPLITPVGYPVIIGKELSYADFFGIRSHKSSITDVEAIDHAAGLYRQWVSAYWKPDQAALTEDSAGGISVPPCTI